VPLFAAAARRRLINGGAERLGCRGGVASFRSRQRPSLISNAAVSRLARRAALCCHAE